MSKMLDILKTSMNLDKAEYIESDEFIKHKKETNGMFLLLKKQITYFKLENKLKTMKVLQNTKNITKILLKLFKCIFCLYTQIHGCEINDDYKGKKLLEELYKQHNLA